MKLSAEQVKGRLRNEAQEQNADARLLLRLFMMERFLERLSVSEYRDNVIVKGGILVTAMVGVSMRSTMDIDATIRNINLSVYDVEKMISNIIAIDVDDDVYFQIKDISRIMEDAEYPGLRITLDAILGKLTSPLKIDISTGDIITPREIKFDYRLMLEDRSIDLWSYNIETILAEKIQTILSRGILNTRMRDFYDIYALMLKYKTEIDYQVLKDALEATCYKRNTVNLLERTDLIYDILDNPDVMKGWEAYQKRYSYARDVSFINIADALKMIVLKIV